MNKKKELLKEMNYKEEKKKKVKEEFEVKTKNMKFSKYRECKNE